MARLKFPKDEIKTSWEWADNDDLMRWARERTNRFDHFSYSPDPETAVFGAFAWGITAAILFVGFLISLLLGPWTWLAVGIIGAVPAFFSIALGLALISGYFTDRESYKNLLRELSKRKLI